MEDSKIVELSQKLVAKNTQLGVLESQNSLLKLKLRLTLREIDILHNKIPSNYDRKQFEVPEVRTRSSQTETETSTNHAPPPRTPATKKQEAHKDDHNNDSFFNSPQVNELSNTLSNLKWGFKRREDSLKQQLDTHKEALHSLYGSYDKLRQQYRSLCNVVCNQLDDTESYMNQRKEQTNLLQTREKEIFVLWDKLKQLEEYKQKYDAIVSNVKNPHYEKDERNESEEDEERKYVKRVKSDDSQLNLRNSKEFDLSPMSNEGSRSPLKRKHNETSTKFDPSSSNLSPFPVADTEPVSRPVLHIDETTLVSMNKPHRSQDDLFYQNNSSKGFGVAVDFLLPHTSPGPSSHFQNKEAMMMLGGSSNEDEEVEKDGVILQQSSDSLEKEDEDQNEHENEALNDRDEEENRNVISDDFFDDQKEGEEDLETTTSLHLEDLQQSPIHPLPSNDAISDVDSVDSLYGLQAMLSPTVPTPSPSSMAPPKTISQNLFGSDRSSAEKKAHFLLQDTSFEISSDKEGFSSRGEEDSASIFRTSSQPPSSTLPPSRKKQVEFTEISIQTEELEEVRTVHTVAVPVQSRCETISTQTDVRPLRDEGTQASTRSILLREAEINTEITGSIAFQPPSSSASKKKVDQIVEVNFPVPSNTIVKGWSSVDQEYLDEMDSVQYQLGERLIELELEKEQALNELKKNMKSNILSSINQKSVTTLSPPHPAVSQRESSVIASSRVALPAFEKDKIEEGKQEEKDRLLQDKDILEKKIFTLQEKIRYLEREKKEYQDTISINQSSYQTEKDLQEVKLKELESKNKQLIQMISEIRVRKVSSEAAIQTEKRIKTSRPRVINLTDKTIGEQEDEVEGEDEDDEEDELSRLLFQENYSLSNPSRQQRSVGKMEVYNTTSAVAVNSEIETNSRSDTYNSSSINLDSSVHSAIFPTSLESTMVIENSLLTDRQQKRSVADSDANAILMNTSVRQPMKKTDLARVSQAKQEFEEFEDEENDENSMTSYSVEEKSSIADPTSSSVLVQERTSYFTPPLPPHTSSIPPPPPMIPATPPQFHTGFVNYYHHPGTTSNGFSNSEDDESNRNFLHDGITFASSGSLIMSKDADDISSTASLPPAVTGIGISRSGSYEDYLNQQFQQFESDMDREIAAVINDGSNGAGVNNSTLDQSRIGPAQGIAFSQDFSEEDEAEDTHLDRLLIEEDENDEYALAKNTMKEVQKYLTAADNREQNTESSLQNEQLPVEDYDVKDKPTLQYQEEKPQSSATKKSKQFSSSFLQKNQDDEVRKDRSMSSTGGVDGGVNLESFELMRLEWENQQLSSKQNDLVRENQKLLRELELYRTKIFTIVHTEQANSANNPHFLLHDLPDINITFQEGNQFQYLSQTTTSSQTLYIIHQLITNNNNLIDRLKYSDVQQQRISNQLKEKEAEVDYLTKELQTKEMQNARLKNMIQQASSTITVTEQDYQILQKQVEVLTKKLQLVMIENQKLSSYYHTNYSSSVISPPSKKHGAENGWSDEKEINNGSLVVSGTGKRQGSSVKDYHPDPTLLSAKKEKIIADLLNKASSIK